MVPAIWAPSPPCPFGAGPPDREWQAGKFEEKNLELISKPCDGSNFETFCAPKSVTKKFPTASNAEPVVLTAAVVVSICVIKVPSGLYSVTFPLPVDTITVPLAIVAAEACGAPNAAASTNGSAAMSFSDRRPNVAAAMSLCEDLMSMTISSPRPGCDFRIKIHNQNNMYATYLCGGQGYAFSRRFAK